jgi:hypothetical protein
MSQRELRPDDVALRSETPPPTHLSELIGCLHGPGDLAVNRHKYLEEIIRERYEARQLETP